MLYEIEVEGSHKSTKENLSIEDILKEWAYWMEQADVVGAQVTGTLRIENKGKVMEVRISNAE